MIPKVKKPPPPSPIISAADTKAYAPPDETARAYASLVNTGPGGLQRKAFTSKKSLLGGT